MDEKSANVRVVGIGASAGGIEALREFFEEIPADTGLAFVVIQHLDPSRSSHMASLLSKLTQMIVAEAEDEMAVEANRIYTIPPGKFVSIKEEKLHLTDATKRDGLRMPIDFFFRSLAEEQGENAVAVLLSGSGSDGTLGIREIHGAAGVVIVQDPKTAQFDSMIEHALATGMVDYALPVREIPGAILRCVGQHRAAQENQPGNWLAQDAVNSILDLLASQTKGDFHRYKQSTIQRRIHRRMGLNQISDISDYYRFLSEQPAEVAKLSQEMLIGVTNFFRDPEAFEELRNKVIAPLVQQRDNADPVRVWIPGCATGEEAYSMAMLLLEEMPLARRNFKLQIFASDIDAEALKRARAGKYPQSITADVSEERLARFFTNQDSAYHVDAQVRDAVTFARHNVIVDPPFFSMDLISCRNLLIYIEPEMQKKILSLFGFALKPGGYLFLGKSESPLAKAEMFEPISNSVRIFRRNSSHPTPLGTFAPRAARLPTHTHDPERQRSTRLSDLNQEILLDHFHASIVLVDENGEIRHFYGPTHRYLSHRSGNASLNLFGMVERPHAPMLRRAFERALRQNDTIRLDALEFGSDGDFLTVTIIPVIERESSEKLLAIIFEDAGAPKATSLDVAQDELENDSVAARLQAENKALRAELQASTDEFQVAHEELTAANEEGMAINEELQSTNEELITSKEELQSLNEELITTNNQLNDKVDELGRVNDDLANFLNSSEVGTIFLDRKFCVRRFTPSATKLMSLLPLDVGRPVMHISNLLMNTDLIAIADGVLKTLIPAEKEVVSTDGRWHILRCLPYRTSKDVIDGVVFTFVDVTRLKRSEEALVAARDYAENIINTTREPLLVLDPELRVISANHAFYETFHVSPTQTENRRIYELGDGQWDIPSLRELLERILSGDLQVENFEVTHNFPIIGPKIMSLNARKMYNPTNAEVRLILLALDDITEGEARARLAAVVDSSEDAIIGMNPDGTITSWNAGAEKIFGYRPEEMIGESILRIVPPGREEEEETEILQRLRRGERVEHFETVRLTKDNRLINTSVTISPIRDARGNVIGASKIIRDITDRARMERQREEFSRELEKLVLERTAELQEANRALIRDMEERQKLEEQLRQSQKLESMGVLAAGVAHDLNNILNIIQGYTSVLKPGASAEDIQENIDVITETTKRGTALVQQLLTLSRKAETKIESINVNALIQRLGDLIKGTFPKTIDTRLDLSLGLFPIMADANQITQVLLNLCVNARDAMPGGGKLTLKTSVVDATDLKMYGDLHSEWFVSIQITDTGTGMDESIRSRIFEPFFTTKQVGQGTGLGLAVVYGIVKNHNGFIEVESQPTLGTSFRVYLPATSS